MTTTREETIIVEGGEMKAHLAVPTSGTGPGVLLIQEIGGVNGYMEEVAGRLANLGYVALAPDVFWRVQPGFVVQEFSDETFPKAIEVSSQVDPALAVADLGMALEHLRELPETTGGVGVLGFCFGGTMAYLVGAEYEPDIVVSYYGSGVAGAIDRAADIVCPMLMHFGGKDPFLPMADIETIESGTSGMENVQIVVQPNAGHAFDNHASPVYYDQGAAQAAWEITAAFLSENLSVE
ncbi:MAG: dienelactone hydrolase family protein [Acidimicrobiia bacterium]